MLVEDKELVIKTLSERRTGCKCIFVSSYTILMARHRFRWVFCQLQFYGTASRQVSASPG